MKQLSVSHAVNVIRAGLFFKHEAYHTEEEYRFLQIFPATQEAPNVKVRGGKDGLVRYREFDWRSVAPYALKQVVIGPAASVDDAKRFVNECLNADDITAGVEVVQSPIPYRA
jgi:hypothetical protein